MRERYVWDRGTESLVRVDEDWVNPSRKPNRMVISDGMDTIKSMADGKHYDSKSRYRAEMKARGFVELGNDDITPSKPEPRSAVEDIYKAMRG